MRGRRGRPGLMGVAARTAVVAGTATAVSAKIVSGRVVATGMCSSVPFTRYLK